MEKIIFLNQPFVRIMLLLKPIKQIPKAMCSIDIQQEILIKIWRWQGNA